MKHFLDNISSVNVSSVKKLKLKRRRKACLQFFINVIYQHFSTIFHIFTKNIYIKIVNLQLRNFICSSDSSKSSIAVTSMEAAKDY